MVVLAAMLTLGLTGCIIPTTRELTEEQEKVITEYAAGLLKKYDNSFSEQLLTDEELEAAIKAEEEQKAKEEKKKKLAEEYLAKVEANEKKKQEEKSAKDKKSASDSGETGNGEAAGVNAGTEPAALDRNALESYFQTEGLNISYKGYEVVDSYPEDSSSFFGVEAAAGKKIVVVNLGVSNNTSDDVFLDMFSEQNRYMLDIGEEVIPADNTVLLNDFSMYRDTVMAGSGVDTVLLFEVPENSAIAGGNGNGASIEIDGGNGRGIIEIQ